MARMRAVSCEGGELSLVDLPDPEPGPGQLVLRVRRTGICGSDLHARRHADELAAVMDELAYAHSIRSTEPTVLGHELCGEVVAQGRGTARSFPLGSRVVAFPLVRGTEGVHPVGLSPLAPGGYAEQVLVEASMSHRVPDALDDDLAALTAGSHATAGPTWWWTPGWSPRGRRPPAAGGVRRRRSCSTSRSAPWSDCAGCPAGST